MAAGTTSARGQRNRRDAAEEPRTRSSRADRAEARRRERIDKMRARAGSRYRVHYDIDGPRVRLGILWFVGALGAVALGPWPRAVFFALAFAAAASHALRTWRARGAPVDPRIALAGTGLVVVAAAFGPKVAGVAVLALAGGALALAAAELGEGVGVGDVLSRASLLLQTSLPPAVAGATFLLLADLEVWAAVALVLCCSAYETGDYLIGSGSANSVEGPVAGGVAVLVTALVVAAAGFPPFDVGEALLFGLATFPLAVLGQLAGSVILPHARAFAPALRRVDSLLLAAPLWYAGVDLLVA